MSGGTYNGVIRTLNGVDRTRCCCGKNTLCYSGSAGLMCPLTLPYQDDYGLADKEVWQPYCLRACIYYNQSISSQNKRYLLGSMDDYNRCIRWTRIGKVGRYAKFPAIIEPDLIFGDEDDPCVSLSPHQGDTSIDWQCLVPEPSLVLYDLEKAVPAKLYNIAHTLVVRVECFRLIIGDRRGTKVVNWRDSGYRFFDTSSTAYFEI